MQQPETKDRSQQVGRRHLEILLEASVVVKAFVNDTERDHGVHQVVVPGDFVIRRKNQRDAVADGEDRNQLRHVFESGQEKHHAKEEQEVVIAREHVACAQ